MSIFYQMIFGIFCDMQMEILHFCLSALQKNRERRGSKHCFVSWNIGVIIKI